MAYLVLILLIFLAAAFQPAPMLAAQSSDSTSRYYNLGLEATDWITSFQVTPPNAAWGIPYQDQSTWGLDPFFFENGTITAEVAGIKTGERQSLAFLIGGHDSGLGASAALDAYLQTKDPKYLRIFDVYFDYFQKAQIPSATASISASMQSAAQRANITLENNGLWAEQADVSAGPDGRYGTSDDSTILHAVFPSPEHGNPIAAALISYYRWSHDSRAIQLLNKYGSWLVRIQIKARNFSGAFPVTQYYWGLGWKTRMFETTESAWILAELYVLTGNETYLDSSLAAGNYMLSRQFTGSEWVGTPVYGALPYEWNQTMYTKAVSTNHAGFTLLAWVQLFRLTGDERFLRAAEKYADWLLNFQVTTADTRWGNHTYANDSMAVGGFYYGYNTDKHEFGDGIALSLWSAAYSIRGLLLLSQTTSNENYLHSALMAADWLTRMRYPGTSPVPLQALAITKYASSSWWGLYPQFYQPDMREVNKAGIPSFVEHARNNPQAIMDRNPTWFERTFNVDFNLIDYQMASRGPEYMKMIWSWWPSVGFEPRYGGDIAIGAFAIGNYRQFIQELQNLQPVLVQIEQMTGDETLGLPNNITASYAHVQDLVTEAERNFNASWYSAAVSDLREASTLAQATLSELGMVIPILQQNRMARDSLEVIAVVLVMIGSVDVYLVYKLRRSESRQQRRGRRKRRRGLHSS